MAAEPARDLRAQREEIRDMLDNISQTSRTAMRTLDEVHDTFAQNNKQAMIDAININDGIRMALNGIVSLTNEIESMLPETPEVNNLLREVEVHVTKALEHIRETENALEKMDGKKAAILNGKASDELNPIRELCNGIKAQL